MVRGHLAYYAVPGNTDAVVAFRTQVTWHWFKSLRRRSQRNPSQLGADEPPRYSLAPARPACMHPFPNVRFDVRTRGRSPVR